MKKKLILALSSCILTLVILECLVRITRLAPEVVRDTGYFRFVDNKNIVYEFIPGSLVDYWTINKQGFKDSDFMLVKPPNLVRIAMLGDSITQGLYIRKENVFSEQLEEMLNQRTERIGSNLKFEVMNFGVGGYNLGAEIETLKLEVLPYKPDIVILNFFHNDDEPIPGLYVFFLNNNDLSEGQRNLLLERYLSQRGIPLINFAKNILYKSKLYLFLLDRLNNLSLNNSLQKKRLAPEEKSNIYKGLSEIKALKEKHRFKFLICIHSEFINVQHPNNHKVMHIATSLGIPCFNMLEYYQKESIPLDSLKIKGRQDTCHPNEFGHLLIAKAILTELKKNGFVDSRL